MGYSYSNLLNLVKREESSIFVGYFLTHAKIYETEKSND